MSDAEADEGFRIVFPRPTAARSGPGNGTAGRSVSSASASVTSPPKPSAGVAPVQSGFEAFTKTFTQGAKAVSKGVEGVVQSGTDTAKLTANQLNKLVDPNAPLAYVVTQAPAPKTDIELLLMGKQPVKIFYPLPRVLAFYNEALVIGHALPSGDGMEYEAAVQLIELAPKLVKMLGDDAPRIDFDSQGWIEEVRGTNAIRVAGIELEASSEDEKNEWTDLFAQLALAGRGWSRHEAVRGTVWSAVVLDDFELLTALAEDVNKPDAKGKCALHYAAAKSQGGNAVAVLLSLGADANALDDDLSAPLHLAALAGNALGVHALLRGGADPDAKDLKERTAFFCAAQAACELPTMDDAIELVAVLEALAEGGADVEARDVDDKTVLHDTVESAGASRDGVLVALLEPPMFMSAVSTFGPLARSPLHQVAARADDASMLAVARILLDHGARPNAADKAGDSPLMLLLRGEPHMPGGASYPILTSERVELAALLVLNGARFDVANAAGQTPADAAKAQQMRLDEKVARWLARREPAQTAAMAADPQTLWNLPRAAEPKTAGGAPASSSSASGISSQLRSRFVKGLENVSLSFQPENEANFCAGCHKAFSFTARKVHCRACGVVFCTQCTSKTFTMSPPASAPPPAVAVKGNVCDACFNQMSTAVSSAAAALDRLSKDREAARRTLGENRAELFQGVDMPELAAHAAGDQRKKTTNSAMGAASAARDALAARGDTLHTIADKSRMMQNNAQDFASNASKLRKQQENAWW